MLVTLFYLDKIVGSLTLSACAMSAQFTIKRTALSGHFWSITRYEDIMFVDKHHDLFSAEPIISIGGQPEGLAIETFIAMDPPKHERQRQAVQGVVAPKNLKEMESLIRARAEDVLNNLPIGEPFDWVQEVSIELTSRMLATLFDFPYEERHKLGLLVRCSGQAVRSLLAEPAQ